MKTFLRCALLLLLASCNVGPNYRAPRFAARQSWNEAGHPTPDGVVQGAQLSGRWWELFGDAQLNCLVERAIIGNYDLRIACQRIREARAQRRVASSHYFPQLDGRVTATRIRESANSLFGGFGGGGTAAFRQLTFSDYFTGFDALWELDLFGRIRKDVQAATADTLAAYYNRRDIFLSLVAEVARNYVELRGFQRQIQVEEENSQLQGEIVKVTRARYESGLSSQVDLLDAEAILAKTLSNIPQLEEGVAQAIHRIGVLLGMDPSCLMEELIKTQPIPFTPPAIPAGLPCDLLCRRPDLRKREWDLIAANARVGKAVADRFPRLSIQGLLGLEGRSLSSIPQLASRTWALTLETIAPLFTGGRLRAEVDAASARYQIALDEYKQNFLVALEEVRDAIVAFEEERKRYQFLEKGRDASRESLTLSTDLYTKGLADFLRVLVAEQSRNSFDEELVQSETRIVTNAIALFKALGGSWELEACCSED